VGLLDDAIREHLDLKRRRGADPAEIERAEHDALGPVRREFDEAAQGDVDLAGANGEAGAEGGFEPDSVPPPIVEEHAGDPDGPEPEQSVEWSNGGWAESASEGGSDTDSKADADFPPAAEPESDDTPGSTGEHEAASTQHPTPADLTGDTVEFDVESSLDDDSEDEQDDVLEETPEFLQDAPDHDRLWFEQRPPRDFDFDS
jgi:hypothetical protein